MIAAFGYASGLSTLFILTQTLSMFSGCLFWLEANTSDRKSTSDRGHNLWQRDAVRLLVISALLHSLQRVKDHRLGLTRASTSGEAGFKWLCKVSAMFTG